jgi:hypothetical protein
MEDTTVKIGLLLETAEAHQATATAALEGLQRHAAGLDRVVREEIRATLIDELQGLHEGGRQAAASLGSLARRADRRAIGLGIMVVLVATAIPLSLGWWLLPAPAEISALSAHREQLRAEVARLTHDGGAVELKRCGPAQRLCARVDRAAPRYGEAADFLVLKGY